MPDTTFLWTPGWGVFISENTATLSFVYTYPEDLKDSCGYKKIVFPLLPDDSADNIIIYMFSEDRQRFGREVLKKKIL